MRSSVHSWVPNARLQLCLAAAALLGACGGESAQSAPPDSAQPTSGTTAPAPAPTPNGGAPTFGYTLVSTLPHDPAAFTEGLFIQDGLLYEGTGMPGKSDIRRSDLSTGTVQLRRALPEPYFGEGVIAFGDKLYELTWKDGKAFVYDLKTFAPKDTLTYYGEGWGLTTDGESIIMSDGSARIRFLDPKTFAVRRTIDVHDGASPVSQLNELEWYKGELLANVWQSTQLVRIDPKTGAVTAWYDLTGILAPGDKNGAEDVLNGIAYDAKADKLYVTGKNYSKLYQITLKGP
jgi:glutamine cyclotransferase